MNLRVSKLVSIALLGAALLSDAETLDFSSAKLVYSNYVATHELKIKLPDVLTEQNCRLDYDFIPGATVAKLANPCVILHLDNISGVTVISPEVGGVGSGGRYPEKLLSFPVEKGIMTIGYAVGSLSGTGSFMVYFFTIYSAPGIQPVYHRCDQRIRVLLGDCGRVEYVPDRNVIEYIDSDTRHLVFLINRTVDEHGDPLELFPGTRWLGAYAAIEPPPDTDGGRPVTNKQAKNSPVLLLLVIIFILVVVATVVIRWTPKGGPSG